MYPLLDMSRHLTLNPHFLGLLGKYCFKLDQALYPIIVSSILMSFSGLYSLLNVSFTDCNSGLILNNDHDPYNLTKTLLHNGGLYR